MPPMISRRWIHEVVKIMKRKKKATKPSSKREKVETVKQCTRSENTISEKRKLRPFEMQNGVTWETLIADDRRGDVVP